MAVSSVNLSVNDHKAHTLLSFLHDYFQMCTYIVGSCEGQGHDGTQSIDFTFSRLALNIYLLSLMLSLNKIITLVYLLSTSIVFYLAARFALQLSYHPCVLCSKHHSKSGASYGIYMCNKIISGVLYTTYIHTCCRKHHLFTGAYYFRGSWLFWLIINEILI